MPHHVVALALPTVVAFDLATVAQIFGHIDETAYTFEVAGTSAGTVTTSTQFTIGDIAGPEAIARADTIVIPGYLSHEPPADHVVEALRSAHQLGCRVASVCTGAFALAATGLLDGLRATTHWQDAAALQQQYPRVQVESDVLYIDHGSLATSAGVAAGIDLGLHLVRRDLGEAEAARIARRMVVSPHRAGGQAQFIEHPEQAVAQGFSDLMAWVTASLDQPISVPEMAKRAGFSERHFARKFVSEVGVTPLQWLIHQRIIAAQRLLETTDLPLEVIAHQVGFGTGATLRRKFEMALQTSPSQYRVTFRGR